MGRRSSRRRVRRPAAATGPPRRRWPRDAVLRSRSARKFIFVRVGPDRISIRATCVHRDLGSKTLGLIGFALAGCAPMLYANSPHGAPDGPRIESTPVVSRDQPSLNDERRPPPCAKAEPDPSVGPAATHAAADESSPGDYLAPGPFIGSTREGRPRTSRPLAEDDLALDPFGGSRYETRRRAGKPIAEDDLAPGPFAGPPREARERARRPPAADDLAPVSFRE